MNIRPATIDDCEALCAIDTVAKGSAERKDKIRDWLTSARCYLAEANGRVAAYCVLTSQFFGYPFIEMVMVGEAFRRQGLGAELIRHVQSVIPASKIFSSANASNEPMRMMFSKLGFDPSGHIDNLDEGDSELIFYCPSPGLTRAR
ncbi:GNAT family N-acetyltransferase [Duganella sp. HH105]|uniref:GNAT family N-acetyltransferase n=1 Tax=Duganella sp. HH105 TaxID=1781067 RepID=UPI000877CE64|nr:GNAT family N-acetyltransferase [Duganella sp. HH105]